MIDWSSLCWSRINLGMMSFIFVLYSEISNWRCVAAPYQLSLTIYLDCAFWSTKGLTRRKAISFGLLLTCSGSAGCWPAYISKFRRFFYVGTPTNFYSVSSWFAMGLTSRRCISRLLVRNYQCNSCERYLLLLTLRPIIVSTVFISRDSIAKSQMSTTKLDPLFGHYQS